MAGVGKRGTEQQTILLDKGEMNRGNLHETVCRFFVNRQIALRELLLKLTILFGI